MKDFFFNVKCLLKLLPFIKRDFLLLNCIVGSCQESQLVTLHFNKGNTVIVLVERDSSIK